MRTVMKMMTGLSLIRTTDNYTTPWPVDAALRRPFIYRQRTQHKALV